MDSLKRLTQQHIEFEPEWETSFNLLIKLQKPISSLIEWCSSDRTVFLECYKCLLHAITQLESTDELFNYKFEKLKFDSHQHEIIEYSVLKQEVSIHAPLTRLFASIYAQMNKYSLNFKTIREQLQSVNLIGLKYDLLNEKMIALIEPSIRALVLVYQTNNGFWKRNGFSLLSQVIPPLCPPLSSNYHTTVVYANLTLSRSISTVTSGVDMKCSTGTFCVSKWAPRTWNPTTF